MATPQSRLHSSRGIRSTHTHALGVIFKLPSPELKPHRQLCGTQCLNLRTTRRGDAARALWSCETGSHQKGDPVHGQQKVAVTPAGSELTSRVSGFPAGVKQTLMGMCFGDLTLSALSSTRAQDDGAGSLSMRSCHLGRTATMFTSTVGHGGSGRPRVGCGW